jgi:hypothetical protein
MTISIEPKNQRRFGGMISLVTPSSKLYILKTNALVIPPKIFHNFKKISIMTPIRIFFHVVMIFSFPINPNRICSSYNKGRRYPKKENVAQKSTQFKRRSSSSCQISPWTSFPCYLEIVQSMHRSI